MALDMCVGCSMPMNEQDTLRDMNGPEPITEDNIESAKRVLINRHDGELRMNAYW